MTQDDDEHEKLLEKFLSIPGTRKAKDGVIFENEEGMFHLRGVMKVPDDLPVEAHLYLEFCTEKEARRILEIATPSDYLLKRRADAIADSPRLVRQISGRKNAWKKAGREWSLSRYYDTLNGPARAYVRRFPKRERVKLNAIVFGLAPLNQPNGVCIRSLVGDVIIVSDSLRNFFYFWCIASLGEFYGLNFEQRIHAFLIALRIMNGAEAMDFEMDPRERLPDAVRSEVNTDVDWMMQFTFAHEFAHHRLGHLDISVEDLDDDVVFSHKLEFDADAHAISSLGRNSFSASKLAWAAHQVFLALHALEIVGKHQTDYPDFSVSASHPSPLDRIAAIERLTLKRPPASPSVIDDAVNAVELLTEAALELIENGDNVLTKYGSIYLPGFDVGHLRDRIDY